MIRLSTGEEIDCNSLLSKATAYRLFGKDTNDYKCTENETEFSVFLDDKTLHIKTNEILYLEIKNGCFDMFEHVKVDSDNKIVVSGYGHNSIYLNGNSEIRSRIITANIICHKDTRVDIINANGYGVYHFEVFGYINGTFEMFINGEPFISKNISYANNHIIKFAIIDGQAYHMMYASDEDKLKAFKNALVKCKCAKLVHDEEDVRFAKLMSFTIKEDKVIFNSYRKNYAIDKSVFLD